VIGVLQQIFSSVKKLQIMVHLMLTNVRMPANAATFFGNLLSIVAYEFVDTSMILP